MQHRTQADALPAQPFFASPGQRVALARERFFGGGQRPTGLVSEPVIQSWARCVGAHRSPHEAVAFDPVTRSRLHATLSRNRLLLGAAGDEIARLEAALGGTGCRVLLTDAEGVIVHATPATAPTLEPVLKSAARVGVNLAEGAVGTNAPGGRGQDRPGRHRDRRRTLLRVHPVAALRRRAHPRRPRRAGRGAGPHHRVAHLRLRCRGAGGRVRHGDREPPAAGRRLRTPGAAVPGLPHDDGHAAAGAGGRGRTRPRRLAQRHGAAAAGARTAGARARPRRCSAPRWPSCWPAARPTPRARCACPTG